MRRRRTQSAPRDNLALTWRPPGTPTWLIPEADKLSFRVQPSVRMAGRHVQQERSMPPGEAMVRTGSRVKAGQGSHLASVLAFLGKHQIRPATTTCKELAKGTSVSMQSKMSLILPDVLVNCTATTKWII